jgi:hypothetical protein
MASPAALKALLEALRSELASRARTTAAAAEQVHEQLWAELEEMGRRLLVGSPPKPAGLPGVAELAELAEALVCAKDWAQIDALRAGMDLARVDCVALMMTVDPQAAVRLLGE